MMIKDYTDFDAWASTLSGSANHPKTKERRKLANYLLEHGADMYIRPQQDSTHDEEYSCWDLAVSNSTWKNGFKYYLNTIFNFSPAPGANIFPILEEWHLRNKTLNANNT